MVHLPRRCGELAATATRGARCFPRRVAELLRAGLDLRDRHAAGEVSRHGLAVARGRLENQLCDLVDDPDLIDLVELEARDLLGRYGFDGEQVPFVRGNARGALEHPDDPASAGCVDELLAALDRHIPAPVRLVDRPLLLAVEGVHTIEGVSWVGSSARRWTPGLVAHPSRAGVHGLRH